MAGKEKTTDIEELAIPDLDLSKFVLIGVGGFERVPITRLSPEATSILKNVENITELARLGFQIVGVTIDGDLAIEKITKTKQTSRRFKAPEIAGPEPIVSKDVIVRMANLHDDLNERLNILRNSDSLDFYRLWNEWVFVKNQPKDLELLNAVMGFLERCPDILYKGERYQLKVSRSQMEETLAQASPIVWAFKVEGRFSGDDATTVSQIDEPSQIPLFAIFTGTKFL